MADYFTRFSEVIPHLRPDEGAWLRDQLQVIHVFEGQEYPPDKVPPHLADRAPDWQGCRFLRHIEDAEEYADCGAGFGHEFADDHAETPDGLGRHLWLHDDEGANLECVVHLVQKFLRQFRPQDCWSLTYAKVCSHPRVGEFGGGGIMVTANQVECLNAHAWLADQRETLQRKAASPQPEATA